MAADTTAIVTTYPSFAAAFFSGFFIFNFLSQPIEIFQMILSSFEKNWLDGVFSLFPIFTVIYKQNRRIIELYFNKTAEII